ncbi:MAG: hypothetical protein EHM18_11675, partial [Acidobacteria bacterium]
YRRGAGLEPLIVDVEDIMDEFNDGVSSPYAIRDFLAHALQNWKQPPKYVVILGDGSYDYRGIYKNYPTNLVPTLMVSTMYGLFASDNALADVNGDFVPDVPIGRLPVLTPAELGAAIDRIIAYEQGPADSWMNNALFVADRPDPRAGNFPEDSKALAGLFPPSYTTEPMVHLPAMSVTQARSSMIARINQGCSVWNYVGHSGYYVLTYSDLFTSSMADQLLSNGQKLPVLTAWSCAVGNFGMVGLESLAEVLMRSPNGGIIAAVGSTGLSDNPENVTIGAEFYSLRFAVGSPVLGDLLVGALQGAAAKGVTPETLYLFGVIGDPALRMR